ncbi:copper homeostasis protein CutC [Frigoriflavimonas asaccharolytica]|uniref:Copper homeostasis protein cutC homolog n=1 Tax=Frigoriflavimonas asaccharolytica TaxID=2735899 RepID=A0A8J8G9R5_9FLAO|nr:copper homeostasis protein CutC [Frigoriflavimonas asaccharolytica]NRS93501.1 copper homeostasis protein [Frigoriflavimonas asaccharolytica]
MLEIACFDLTSAEIALASVADRIEFCRDRFQGGTTPDLEEFKYLKEKFDKPIYIMIRPKGGDFYYSDDEFAEMIESINKFKKYGADGFVFGILGRQQEIDLERNKFLLDLAHPIPCTFHKAIDRVPDYELGISKIVKLGFHNVLTSGGAENLRDGAENIKKSIEKHSDKINIIIGGGLRSDNIKRVKEETGGSNFHSSAITKYGIFADETEISEIKTWI